MSGVPEGAPFLLGGRRKSRGGGSTMTCLDGQLVQPWPVCRRRCSHPGGQPGDPPPHKFRSGGGGLQSRCAITETKRGGFQSSPPSLARAHRLPPPRTLPDGAGAEEPPARLPRRPLPRPRRLLRLPPDPTRGCCFRSPAPQPPPPPPSCPPRPRGARRRAWPGAMPAAAGPSPAWATGGSPHGARPVAGSRAVRSPGGLPLAPSCPRPAWLRPPCLPRGTPARA